MLPQDALHIGSDEEEGLRESRHGVLPAGMPEVKVPTEWNSLAKLMDFA